MNKTTPIDGWLRVIRFKSATHFWKVSFAICSLLFLTVTQAQTAFTATYTLTGGNDVTSLAYNGSAITGVTPGALTKVGISTSSSSGNFRGSDWPTGNLNTGDYIQFSVAPVSGYKFTITSITFGVGRSATGPVNWQWRGSGNSFASAINNYTTLSSGLTNASGALTNPDTNSSWTGNVLNVSSLYSDQTTTATFRLYGYNSEASGGTGGLQGNLVIQGTYQAVATNPTLVVASTALTAFSTTYGTPSNAQGGTSGFSISGSNLTANVSIQAGTGFEVSINGASGTYAASQTLTQSSGSASGAFHIRLRANASAGLYNSQTAVTISSTDATSVTKATTASGNQVIVKGLTITGVTAQNKVYDGTTTATLTGTAAYSGLVNGETFSVSGTPTASFTNAIVGNNKPVTVTGYGVPNSNYSVTQPSLQANITARPLEITGISAADKVYDGTTQTTLSGTPAYSNLASGQSFAVLGTAEANFTTPAVGDDKTVNITGYLPPNTNYTVTQPLLQADITKRDAHIVGVTANDKVADGTTTATLNGSPVIAEADLISGDDVIVTGTPIANFNTPDVGVNKPVTVTGYTLTGAASGNYNPVQPSNLSANILSPTAANQTITFNALTSVTYGDATFALTASASSDLAVTYQSSNTDVATVSGNIVTIIAPGTTTITASQNGNASYNPAQDVTQDLEVLQKSLQITGVTAAGKVYDGTTEVVLSGGELSGVINSDAVSFSGGGVFATAAVGEEKQIVTSFVLTGTDAFKYILQQPTTITASITARNLTVSGLAANNKVYDATTSATLSGTAVLVNVVSGDTNVALAGTPIASFADAGIGTGKPVSVSGYTLSGSSAANYTLTQPSSSANITVRSVSITGLSVQNKEYDGTADATLVGTPELNGVATGDELNVTLTGTGVASFANPAAGPNQPVSVNGFSLGGTSAGNYTLTLPTGLVAEIYRKELTIVGVVADDKVYNGNTIAILSNTGTLEGVIASDSGNVSIVGTGVFASANAGDDIGVTLSITGSAAANYLLLQPGIFATISKATQTITFNVLPTLTTDSGTLNLNSYATTTSGLVLTFNSSSPSVATIAGNTLTITGEGTATITASQPGNINYLPAEAVTRELTVLAAPIVLAAWDVNGVSNFGPSPFSATQFDDNVEVVGLTRGSGVGSSGSGATNAWGGNGWTTATTLAQAISGGKFVTFSISATTGATVSFSSVSGYNIRRSAGGPSSGQWQYSVDGGAYVNIGSEIDWGSSTAAGGNTQSSIDLANIAALQDLTGTVTFRIVNYGATGSTGTWYLNTNSLNSGGLDFVVNGYATPAPPVDVIWTGSAWTGNNGNPPNATMAAIIQGAYDTSVNSGITAQKLTIAPQGSLVVAGETSIYVQNEIVNERSQEDFALESNFLIESNANVIQFANIRNSGPATVLRDSQQLLRLDYTMWSSPVEGQNVFDFSPQTVSNRFYFYNPATDGYRQLFVPAAPNGSGWGYDQATYEFHSGFGYQIRVPNNHPETTPTTWTGTFVGEPHSGNYDVPVLANAYNAVGNPYPSPISADEFIALNDIDEPLYFWRKTNGAPGSAYATYSDFGMTNTAPSDGDPLWTVPNGYIQTGQGFIVFAPTSTIQFNNDLRKNNFSNQFFRSAAIATERHRIWVNLTGDSGLFSQAMIGYTENASVGIDAKIDGRYVNDSPNALTSLIDGQEFTIQGRGLPFQASDVVPMGFKSETAGNFSISIDHVDGLFSEGQPVLLRDNLLATVHDFSQGAYAFTSEAGVFNVRFEIIYDGALAVGDPMVGNDIIVVGNENGFTVKSKSRALSSVKLYDVTGRLVATASGNENEISIASPAANVVWLLEITDADANVVIKKAIR